MCVSAERIREMWIETRKEREKERMEKEKK